MKKLALLAAFILVGINPVFALDLTQLIRTLDGKDFVGTDGKPLGLTYDLVIESSLLTAQAANEKEKTENYLLARKVHENSKSYNPTPEEMIQIKKAVAATQVTAIFGQVMTYLGDANFSAPAPAAPSK